MPDLFCKELEWEEREFCSEALHGGWTVGVRQRTVTVLFLMKDQTSSILSLHRELVNFRVSHRVIRVRPKTLRAQSEQIKSSALP